MRPRSRCAPWARSSTACARPGTTSPRSPTSRARPGWPRCCGGRPGCRRPAAPTSSGSSGATTCSPSTAAMLGRVRRQLMSQGRRNRQLPRVPGALLDALWSQVRGERGRDRGRDAFDDDLLGDDEFLDFVLAWWPPLDARTVLGWLRDPELLARVSDGLLSHEEQRLLAKSWGSGDERRACPSRTCPLIDELRYALGDVPLRTDDERDLDETSLLEGGHDMQELMTASDREYAPSGRAWARADAPARGRPVRARPGRRGAGPHADAVADGRPARQDRVLDDRRRPGAVVVAGPGRVRRGARDRARGQGAARVPPLDQLPQLLRDLRVRRGVRPARRARRRPAHRGPLDGHRAAARSPASPTSSPRPARPCSTSPAGCPGTVGIVVPVARRSEANAWLASWPELAAGRRRVPAPPSTPRSRRRARTASWC